MEQRTARKTLQLKYEFNTVDEQGNKIMDKMSREETLQAMKTISAQYGDNVIVEFSGDGLAALVESKKGALDKAELQESANAKQAAFDKEVVQLDKKAICGDRIYNGEV